MGKYFKEQEQVTFNKKRFKTSLSDGQNIREAGLASAVPSILSNLTKLKNFFWAWNKISKTVKLDSRIVTKIQDEFLTISKVHKAAFDQVDSLLTIAKSELDDINNGVGKYAGLQGTAKSNAQASKQAEIDKLKTDIKNINDIASKAIGKEIDEFNRTTDLPVRLKWTEDLRDPRIDWGILSKPGQVIDQEGLSKVLMLMRESAPAHVDPAQKLMSIFRGGVGLSGGDVLRPYRNISKDVQIRGLMGKTYEFIKKDPNTGKDFTISKSLNEILEEIAKNGRFETAELTIAPGQKAKIAEDFQQLIGRASHLESGLKNPAFISAASSILTGILLIKTYPFVAPMVSNLPNVTKRFTNQDEEIQRQEKVNQSLKTQENQEATSEYQEAIRNKYIQDLNNLQIEYNNETNPIMKRAIQRDINRIQRRLNP